MLSRISRLYKPAPHKPQLPQEEVEKVYPHFRRSILLSTFIGYATFYLVRNNLSPVAKDIGEALSYDKSMIGDIFAVTAISYGLGKFLMGAVSDRCNPRFFMPTGLIFTAICNFAFGASNTYPVHLFLWAINGFVQGMGWPPCGRCLGHWYSVRERGLMFGIWNVSHNVGGGVAGYIAAYSASAWGWSSAFYVPGVFSLIIALYLFWKLRDTPQSVGLPPIEVYHNDITEDEQAHGLHEKELTSRELFIENIFKNKWLWLFAISNFFLYICRYSMLDWGPTYLREVKGADIGHGGLSVLILEFAGIPSTILISWLSDKLSGRRGMVSVLCIIPLTLAFVGIVLNPAGNLALDMVFLAVIGFFVYPPLNLVVVAGLDLTSKKAVGTAAGFIGLFGYLGRMVQGKGFGWMAQHYGELYGQEIGWYCVIWSIVVSGIITIILLSFTWNLKPKA